MNATSTITVSIMLVVCAAASICTYIVRRVRRQSELDLRLLQEQCASQTETQAACLRELGREYDALLTGCGAGVLVLDTHDNIVEASPEAARLLNAPTSQQLIGRSLLQATLSAELMSRVRCARTDGTAQNCEIRLPPVSGACMSISVIPTGTTQDVNARCLVIAHDVTELRRLETVRRDFVANVSHELRTPLTSIRAMAETLQDGALSDGEVADRFLGIISTEAQRLTRISEDLLILSHAESRSAESIRFNISNLVEDVVNRFIKQAEGLGLKIVPNITAGVMATGSPDQIEQVLINLVDNAIKYTSAGGTVRVTVDTSGTMACVHIADTGIGIMSQDVPRIFERFYRVDKARSRASGGTGLGLSIVKHIVEAHGGKVTVESEYNHGSTFTFTIPLA